MYTPVATHERDGESISVGYGIHNEWMVVFDGFDGLETTIRFSDVNFERNEIEFEYSPRVGRMGHTVATIENTDLGDVTDFLERFTNVVSNHKDPMEELVKA